MSIKTLHLTNAFHASSGGIATFYMAMLQQANRRQREMRLLVPGPEDKMEQVGRYGRIYYVRARTAPLNHSYRCILPWQYLCPEDIMRRILREERPDVIEICDKYNLHFLGGMIRERLCRDQDFRPVMVGLSCERMDENVAAYLGDSTLHRMFCRWYMHWLYFPFFDHHVAVSLHAASELVNASKCHRVRRGIWIRPMGVDAVRFSPDRRSEAARQELLGKCGGSAETILLLYAGRLAPEKNLSLLIETMASLESDRDRDYRLLLVGDGMERERLQRQARETVPDKVCFLEHIADREQLARVYASCDLFLHPNPREPFGIAPLEAMASGLPLVATDRGGITSFANHSNAWLAPPEASAFASAVRDALADEPARTARVRTGLLTAGDHDWSAAAQAYFDMYDAMHAEFSGLSTVDTSSAHAWSTEGSGYSKAMIQASSLFAQTVSQAMSAASRLARDLQGAHSALRHLPLMPSVTVTEEKQRQFRMREGQT
jgi:alpha-1,6-mannosyltransferase